jgi:hypothetical protein
VDHFLALLYPCPLYDYLWGGISLDFTLALWAWLICWIRQEIRIERHGKCVLADVWGKVAVWIRTCKIK